LGIVKFVRQRRLQRRLSVCISKDAMLSAVDDVAKLPSQVLAGTQRHLPLVAKDRLGEVIGGRRCFLRKHDNVVEVFLNADVLRAPHLEAYERAYDVEVEACSIGSDIESLWHGSNGIR
jgi:hypothetical protein